MSKMPTYLLNNPVIRARIKPKAAYDGGCLHIRNGKKIIIDATDPRNSFPTYKEQQESMRNK